MRIAFENLLIIHKQLTVFLFEFSKLTIHLDKLIPERLVIMQSLLNLVLISVFGFVKS